LHDLLICLWLIYSKCIKIEIAYNTIRELLKGESKDLLKLPTDKALVEDPIFRNYVELYAKVTDKSKSWKLTFNDYID